MAVLRPPWRGLDRSGPAATIRKGEQDNSLVSSRTQEVVGWLEAEGFLGFFKDCS